MCNAPGSTTLRRLSAVGLLVSLVALGACGGGGSSAGVASLDSNTGSQDTAKDPASSKDAEAELQKWVECMRDKGVDMPDPTTDADGNLTLRPGGGGAGPSTDARSSTDQPPAIDRDAMDAARKECGDPPQGATGGFDRGNSQEFQDSALKYAKCMRDNGVDMPDPVFDDPSAGGGRPEGGPRLFGDSGIDRSDPAVAKAMDACRDIMPGRGGGPGGGPGGSSSNSSSATGA